MTKSGGLLLGLLLALFGWLGFANSAVAASPVRDCVARFAWNWPLREIAVIHGFEPPPTPYSPGHRGVDLAAKAGSAVCAAGNGVVSFAGQVGGAGVITIQHGNGLRSTYEPVIPTVHKGQTVVAGQFIGNVGFGHPSCGNQPCLHWGLISGDRYLDPRLLLAEIQSRVRVRLLPLWSDRAVSRARPGLFGAKSDLPTVSAADAAGSGVQRSSEAEARPHPHARQDNSDRSSFETVRQIATADGWAIGLAIGLAGFLLLFGRVFTVRLRHLLACCCDGSRGDGCAAQSLRECVNFARAKLGRVS